MLLLCFLCFIAVSHASNDESPLSATVHFSHMGGMDEMGLFYDSCLETLYPPGSCGSFCNDHTFDCYLAEVQEACCDEGGVNCVSGEDVPETCPVGCAIVFPQFLETCTDHLAGTGANVADFEAFSAECLQLDGVELVEYAIMLLERGCAINLGGMAAGRRQLRASKRQLQGYLTPHLSSEANQCTWDQVSKQLLGKSSQRGGSRD